MGIAMSRVSIDGAAREAEEGPLDGESFWYSLRSLPPSAVHRPLSAAAPVINARWGELQTRRSSRFIGLIGVFFVVVFAG